MTINYTPYASSGIIKSPSIVSLNYTNQDFWSMKSRLIDFIKERFGPTGTVLPNTFNDFVESSVAIMLIENWAFLADTLSFKMDQIINELFIDTVTEIDNAFRLAKLIGFQPQPPIASVSMWTGTLNALYNYDILLATPVPVSASIGNVTIPIELFAAGPNNEPLFNQDIIISANTRVNSSIIGLQGATTTTQFTGTGQVSQTYTLPDDPVIYNSVQVNINGEGWNLVDAFTDSQPRKEFRVEYDSNYRGYVIFGNNRAGLIPPDGCNIAVQYRIGGGVVGNIVTGYVEVQRMGQTLGTDNGIPVTFRNYTRGMYGYDGDTIADVRSKLPLWVQTQNRAVSGQDYQILTGQFVTAYHGNVGKSIALLRNQGCAGNIVDIYILAQDGAGLAKASDELKDALYSELDKKKMLTDYVCIKDGIIILVDVTVELYLDRVYNKFEQEIRDQALQRINSFFSLSNLDFGKPLIDNDLIKYLSDMKQVNGYAVHFKTSTQEGSTIVTNTNEIIQVGNNVLSLIFQ